MSNRRSIYLPPEVAVFEVITESGIAGSSVQSTQVPSFTENETNNWD